MIRCRPKSDHAGGRGDDDARQPALLAEVPRDGLLGDEHLHQPGDEDGRHHPGQDEGDHREAIACANGRKPRILEVGDDTEDDGHERQHER
jgi:hypothetical protein